MTTRNVLILPATTIVVALIIGIAFNLSFVPAVRSMVEQAGPGPKVRLCPPDLSPRECRILQELDAKYGTGYPD